MSKLEQMKNQPKPSTAGKTAGAEQGSDKNATQSTPQPNHSAKDSHVTNLDQTDANGTHSGSNGGTGKVTEAAKEIGGQKGPEPTRYGDWEKNGRCTDF